MNCKVCGSSIFNIYGKAQYSSELFKELSPESLVPLNMTYVECNQCATTIWGIEAEPRDYPYLTSDRERWTKKLKGERSGGADDIIKELLQRAAGNEKFKDLIAGLMK